MPYSSVLLEIPHVLRQVAYERRLEMMADDDGMAQPYYRLQPVIEPRTLTWFEEKALRQQLLEAVAHASKYRNDLAAFCRDFWQVTRDPPFPKLTMREWQAQYLQDPSPPAYGLGSTEWRERDKDETESGGEL